MTVTITVTQEDIDDGVPQEPCSCPVSLAVWREFPRCHDVDSQFDFITIRYPFFSQYAETTNAVREFIERFDRNEPVEPFSFELELLED